MWKQQLSRETDTKPIEKKVEQSVLAFCCKSLKSSLKILKCKNRHGETRVKGFVLNLWDLNFGGKLSEEVRRTSVYIRQNNS